MPRQNRFRHQAYRCERPTSPFRLCRSGPPTDPASAQWRERLAAAGQALSAAGVDALLLVHGTFAGDELFGFFAELARYAPPLAKRLQLWRKRIFDSLVREAGNYTDRYAVRLEEALSPGRSLIGVSRLTWCGLNHHLGRAEGAVRLVNALARIAQRRTSTASAAAAAPRVLAWTHSHGGNVAALATHLLSGDADSRGEFFAAGRKFARSWRGVVQLPEWEEAETTLADAAHPIYRQKFDVVAFGAPIRYGWEMFGYGQLLQIIQHRPHFADQPWRAPFPPSLRGVIRGVDGDVVQQIGIAGTNVPPPLTGRAFVANRRYATLLERDLPRESLWTRLARGARVPEEGPTLLVEYADSNPTAWLRLAGHAVYTRSCWAPLHAELAAAELYAHRPEGEGR